MQVHTPRRSILVLVLLGLVPHTVTAASNRWTSLGPDGGFGLLGVLSDVDAAYCLVEADGFGPLYPPYAAVIDNQSQDPILVPGQNDPEPPPP